MSEGRCVDRIGSIVQRVGGVCVRQGVGVM